MPAPVRRVVVSSASPKPESRSACAMNPSLSSPTSCGPRPLPTKAMQSSTIAMVEAREREGTSDWLIVNCALA
jgi:hypothetical protein